MPWERAVNSSGCVAFDGTNDYVDISSESTFDLPNYLSVSFWVYRLGSTGFWQPIITKGNGGAANGGFFFALDNRTSGYVEFQIATNSSNILGKEAPLLPGWNHVVGTYDKNEAGTAKLKLYVNGREGGTYYPTGSVTTIGLNNYTLKFGTHEGATTFAKILLDDVRIYNRALTAAEVQSIYRNSSSPPTLGLVCYFPLNEGTGTTVTDSIGGLTGTLTNGPTWQTQVAPRLRPDRDVAPRAKAYSLSFDGSNDYVALSSAVAATQWTIAAWVKIRSFQTSYMRIFSQAADNLDVAISPSGLLAVFDGGWKTFGTSVGTSAWVYVAVKFDGASLTPYVNGVALTPQAGGRALSGNSELGRWYGQNFATACFNGEMRDIRVYASALSDANIRTLVIGGDVSGAVGKWELNEGTGTTAADTGSGGNNGTLTPNPTGGPTWSTDVPQWWRQDRHTWALSFDGTNDYVQVAAAGSGPLAAIGTGDFTVSAWVKNLNSGSYTQIISNWSVTGFHFLKTTTGNRLGAYVGDNVEIRCDFVMPTDGVWTHCVVTRQSGTVKLYADGAERSIVTGNNTGRTGSLSASVTRIGANPGGSQVWSGGIKDVRIYDSALSASDIAKLANNVEPSATPVSHWPLDEGAGTTAIDKISCNNGTLVNGPTWTGDIPQWFRRTIESSYAGSFDGINDYINLGSDATIDNLASSDFTVTSWINLSGSPSAGLNYRILDKANSSGLSGWEVYVHDTNRYLAAFVDMGTTDANYISNVSLALSTWYPVAGVWSSSANTFKLYNAAIETTYSASTAGSGTKPDDSANNMSIGALAPLNARYFNGKIDETCIYRRALTAAELADIAAGYLVTAGMISRYKLDNDANDVHGLNHGTEQGGVSYSSAVPATIAKRPRRSGFPFA